MAGRVVGVERPGHVLVEALTSWAGANISVGPHDLVWMERDEATRFVAGGSAKLAPGESFDKVPPQRSTLRFKPPSVNGTSEVEKVQTRLTDLESRRRAAQADVDAAIKNRMAHDAKDKLAEDMQAELSGQPIVDRTLELDSITRVAERRLTAIDELIARTTDELHQARLRAAQSIRAMAQSEVDGIAKRCLTHVDSLRIEMANLAELHVRMNSAGARLDKSVLPLTAFEHGGRPAAILDEAFIQLTAAR